MNKRRDGIVNAGGTLVFLLVAGVACAQTPKEVRAAAKQGVNSFPALQGYLKNADNKVRDEAVKGIVEIGGPKSVDLLIEATRDNDENIQIRAADGLVNFYLPGYVPSGVTAPLKRASAAVKDRFGDRNDQIVEAYVKVRSEAIQALSALIRGGASPDSRANAARAAGILRGRDAEADLLAALKSKDSAVLLEAITALEKIGDESAGPRLQFLLRDLNERVQIAAIETTGALHNRAALADLRGVVKNSSKVKARRAALASIAMLPDRADRPVFAQYLADRDDAMRAAAAEGLGRLRDPADLGVLESAWQNEPKRITQISLAFALVLHGRTGYSESSPLRFLVQSLDLSVGRATANPLLTEAARDPGVRLQMYIPLERGTKEQKIAIAQILGAVGDRAAEPHLEKASREADPQVAEEGLRALRNLRARL